MVIDAARVRRAFARAAGSYDAHAALQREVATRLLERLDGLTIDPATIVDLGCGTGAGATALKQRFPHARVIAMDHALPMLAAAGRRRGWRRPRMRPVAGDARALPLADASVDLVYSNLMLQWCDPPGEVLDGLRRVLRPGGLLLLSTFGPDTLRELRAAWAEADPGHPHVSRFHDVIAVGNALTAAGFSDPVLDTDWLTTRYTSVHELMRELKGLGAGNAEADRQRGLTPPGRMQAMLQAYASMRDAGGRYPASWEVVYASAWGPPEGRPVRTAAGEEASVSVSNIPLRRRP